MNRNNKVSLFVMQQRGARSLQAVLCRFNKDVVDFVVSAKDPNVQGDSYEQIKYICEKNAVKFFDRSEQPKPVESGLSIAIGWRWLIDGADRLVVIHDSLLPKYRGFAPLVNSLIDGSTVIGATAFYATDNYDEGQVLGQGSVPVSYPIKIADAIEQLTPVFEDLTCKLVQRFKDHELDDGVPQVHADATYSLWRDEEDYRIDWHRTSAYIRRCVDALGPPYSGASSQLNGKKVKVFDCQEYDDVSVVDRQSHIGKVIFVRNLNPVVICGDGLLMLKDLEDEAGNKLIPLKRFRSRFR